MAKRSQAKISVIIPAHNEEQGIGEVVSGVYEALGREIQVLVVDDASTDRTGERAREAGAEVIVHPYRKGNGAAIKTGARHAGGEITVMLDGDGQHPPARIMDLLAKMDRYEMVVGARENYADISLFRTFGNWMYNVLASYVTGMTIPDLTSGFRAIRTDLLRRYLYLLPNGYSYPTTITLALIKAGFSVTFVPFICNARSGVSKLNPFKDGVKFFVILLRIATLFSPMKVFGPVAGVSACLGILWYLYVRITDLRFPKVSLLLIIVGVMVFLMGLVAEQIAMLRMETRE